MARKRARRDAVLASAADPVAQATECVPVEASFHATIRGALGARKFEVVVLAAGFGLNSEQGRQWYVPDTDEGLGSALKVFGGAKVHWARGASADFDHRRDDTPLAAWLDGGHEVGYLSDLRRVEGSLVAVLNVADDVPPEVVEVIAARRVGLSIEASADRRPSIRDGKAVVELVNFRHGAEPASVAVVSHPALHGEILRVAASRRSPPMNREQAIAILASTTATPEQVAEARRVLASTTGPGSPTPPVATLTAEAEARIKAAADEARTALQASLVESQRMIAVTRAEAQIAGSKLPAKSAAAVLASITAEIAASDEVRKDPTARTTALIDAKRAELAEFDARVHGSGRVEVGAGVGDKAALGFERLVMNDAPEYALKVYAERFHGGKLLASREQEAGIGRSDRASSFRRLFREATGHEVTDLWRSRESNARVRAAIASTTFDDAWENVLNRALLAYSENPDFSDWRKIVRITSFDDIRKKERIVKGGYGNLPAVAQGSNYTAATSPTDQGHGWTPAKYGYTEQWTREAMMNDDVGLLADIPRSMGLAAARTLYEYVFDQLTIAGQPTMDYDSTSLFAATTHSNKGTSALTATSLAAARLAMKKQADLSNSKRMMVIPRYILVPEDKEETAYNLLKAAVEEPGGLTSERAWLRRMNLEVIVVRHWTNTGDWFLSASPTEFPTFELGFEGGMQEPQLFVQDDKRLGSMFDRDAITLKLAHGYYGGSPLRHEGFYANDV